MNPHEPIEVGVCRNRHIECDRCGLPLASLEPTAEECEVTD